MSEKVSFKVGDRVEFIGEEEDELEVKKGEIYTIEDVDTGDDTVLLEEVGEWAGFSDVKKTNRRIVHKPKPFLVVWDEGGEDPVKTFGTLNEAKEFAEKLHQDEDNSNICIYQVSKKFEISFGIKQVRI